MYQHARGFDVSVCRERNQRRMLLCRHDRVFTRIDTHMPHAANRFNIHGDDCFIIYRVKFHRAVRAAIEPPAVFAIQPVKGRCIRLV